MLTGKTIVLGVTGGIAAYKSANLASMLIKLHAPDLIPEATIDNFGTWFVNEFASSREMYPIIFGAEPLD